ncbi:MAG TPA: Gamma-glutamyltranspeptidase [Gammaproteobacteria bacterium]|nr:Gamma-glutamyltranspeptidase [Gammaproteobacteria bacterium]
MTTPARGAVAAGHAATADAAAFALREGGNAFDAVIAAHWTACVAEPVLTSPGGGGFLLAQPADRNPRLYDFFAQTPMQRRPASDIDFHPIQADFGTTCQEFHIGYGAVATPGTVRGLFNIQHELGSLPMPVLMQPAIELARNGVVVNALQAYILDVVRPIYLASPQAAQCFASPARPGQLVGEDETLHLPQLADTLQALSEEGERLFYEGEIAAQIEAACHDGGGHLTRKDLAAYQVKRREPLHLLYRGADFYTNPPPATGGLLIGFALKLLERLAPDGIAIDNPDGITLLAEIMRVTNQARLDHIATDSLDHGLLDPELLQQYRQQVMTRTRAWRGTTHISVIDRAGNLAALTTSNGEGCGHMLSDTGIMLNNMLGEEDLNPHGFHAWQENRRLTSMMAPGLLRLPDGRRLALGSGGSNRIRSAILQVILRLVDEGLPLAGCVTRPRIHFENGLLNIEGGFEAGLYAQLQQDFDNSRCWPDRNLYFGGVHVVALGEQGFDSCGDQRRGGVAFSVD